MIRGVGGARGLSLELSSGCFARLRHRLPPLYPSRGARHHDMRPSPARDLDDARIVDAAHPHAILPRRHHAQRLRAQPLVAEAPHLEPGAPLHHADPGGRRRGKRPAGEVLENEGAPAQLDRGHSVGERHADVVPGGERRPGGKDGRREPRQRENQRRPKRARISVGIAREEVRGKIDAPPSRWTWIPRRGLPSQALFLRNCQQQNASQVSMITRIPEDFAQTSGQRSFPPALARGRASQIRVGAPVLRPLACAR